MAHCFNSVVLQGWVTRDPILMQTRKGTYFTRCGISSPVYTFIKEKGEIHRGDCMVDFVLWGPPARRFCFEARKGDVILISGYLRRDVFETRDGETKYTHTIRVRHWDHIMDNDMFKAIQEQRKEGRRRGQCYLDQSDPYKDEDPVKDRPIPPEPPPKKKKRTPS